MAHFTYSATPDMDTLNQGDVLEKTEEIKEILQAVHPHYLKDDYQHFIVITQSCDLVRRDGETCKAPYITLAAVRPFLLLVEREVRKYQRNPIEIIGRLVNANFQQRLSQLLERIFNNNEHEFFYLHEDDSIGFPQSVAFVRLSIAIKSNLHYDKCLSAKRLQLKDSFQAKLGWLIGNIYSRVGTEDWAPDNVSEQEFKNLIAQTLENSVVWVDDKKLNALKKSLKDVSPDDLVEEQIHETLKKTVVQSRKDRFIDRLESIVADGGYVDASMRKTFMTTIRNDPELGQILK
ncbi:MAG: hypothetical protein HYV06_04640 [Deltaproteobacteria bacterium]|nr:hypothetical protein [Deltaproteobacteria bacterium]